MAVYTEVAFDDASRLIATLGIGTLQTLAPCSGGIENTNYFADTDRGRYVLTLFERLTADELPFYLRLMKHLADAGLPVPGPHAAPGGELLFTLAGKPAAVVDRLPGGHHLAPDSADCATLGELMARLHAAVADFPLTQPNLRGLDWWRRTVPEVLPCLTPDRAALMADELAWQEHLATTPAYRALPRGAVHADLFRDNAMFDGKRLSGVFDFYFAGIDTFGYDLAVALNDWCVDLATGRLDEARAEALVHGYETVRKLEPAEHRLLPALLRSAAFRFWLSRSWDLHLPRTALVLKAHDPDHFERILVERRQTPWHPT